jgi:hypothetical protein
LERAIAGAAIDAIIHTLADSAPACFATRGYPAWFVADTAFLRERGSGRRFLFDHECPPHARRTDGLPGEPEGSPLVRPPGYVASHLFRINRPYVDRLHRGRIRIERHQGSLTYWYECQLDTKRVVEEHWRATCRVVDSIVR